MKVGDLVYQRQLPEYIGCIMEMKEVTNENSGWTTRLFRVRWLNKLYDYENIPEWRLRILSEA